MLYNYFTCLSFGNGSKNLLMCLFTFLIYSTLQRFFFYGKITVSVANVTKNHGFSMRGSFAADGIQQVCQALVNLRRRTRRPVVCFVARQAEVQVHQLADVGVIAFAQKRAELLRNRSHYQPALAVGFKQFDEWCLVIKFKTALRRHAFVALL